MHLDLYCHPYKIQIVQELSDHDITSRRTFCEQFVPLVNKHPYVIRYFIMSDEAHFELSGYVNKQNVVLE